ncbi:MBL fold metallo-hydrolase [Sunxiuqinia elliptica]|uniref:Phosphoribosyl 1,2-cyclic phosphodiesterase n=1 Tax=Sunxiuqinia elliptica TaxID=655355 RepID=A0A1I2EHN2_9BACT|nr:MBL fold metallo-hydrolase [Sunxiuqinia elliptica]SFE92036.1 Phosphoribosyl 1,2-cyclic phosphodiesterase [Sunxiuqinia elliptica]
MSKIEICALASGSNGNCYYIGNDKEALLVDAGLSARQLQMRLAERQIDQRKIKAVLITHEHSDHCRGARVLGKRFQIPVYLTKKTFLAMRKAVQPETPRWFEPNQDFQVGEFLVTPFAKQHDAADACSFRISYAGKHVGVMTDIGEACDRVKEQFSQCHAVFLESNYDHDMLMNGPYPYYLKQRVSSSRGHLSNEQACDLLQDHAGAELHTIFLSHLSGENNTPEKAYAVFEPLSTTYRIELTSRHGSTELVEI